MSAIQPINPPMENTIKARLIALLEVLIKQSKLNPLFLPTIKTLAFNFLRDADEAELRKGIIEVKEKFIPWILGNEVIEGQTHEYTQDTIKE